MATTRPIANSNLPTPPLALTSVFHQRPAYRDTFGAEIIRAPSRQTFITLEPTVGGYLIDEHGDPCPQVSTVAQEFIWHPYKSWWNNENPRIRAGAPHCPKFLIWARAVLVLKFEKGILERAGIVKGVLASLYKVENCWPLLEAFISFWNSDGHTIVTPRERFAIHY